VKFQEFLKEVRYTRQRFADETGLPRHKLDAMMRGCRPTLRTAIVIEDFTSTFGDDFMVGVRDLLDEKESAEVDELWNRFKKAKRQLI
jgi:hypothetical protein